MTDDKIISDIWNVITDRTEHPLEGSYVNGILSHRKGIDKALEKVGEEATEFILAAKNGNRRLIAGEAADLQFHLLLALKASGITLDEMLDELRARRK